MHIEIMADVPPNIQDEIAHWDDLLFTEPVENVAQWSISDYQLLVWEGNQWVSSLHLFDRTIKVGDEQIRVGGIGGVMTLPHWRNQGYAAHAMNAAAEYMQKEMRVAFGFLICAEELVGYYGKLGWQQIHVDVVHQQIDGMFSLPASVKRMIYIFGDKPWPDGDVNLLGLPW